MSFGNKDLLTKVLPQISAGQFAKLCVLRTFICRSPTFCLVSCPRFISVCGNCSILITEFPPHGCQLANSCGAGGSACDPTQFCIGSDPYVIQDLEDLVTIRAELTLTLKQLDAMEKEGIASGITTRAEADAAELSLKAQLDHVKKVKEGLK
jgi:hypothetical protein